MHELLPFIIVGITAGSVYGLAATGLVLTYRTSGIFNFAHGAVAAFGLAWLLRRTRLGSAMRALVDDPDLLSVAGWNPTAVRRMSWFIGSAFAVASGILIAPTLSLDAVLLSFLVVQAFGAAALGRFTSLPLTYAGGLAIGVAASLLTKH